MVKGYDLAYRKWKGGIPLFSRFAAVGGGIRPLLVDVRRSVNREIPSLVRQERLDSGKIRFGGQSTNVRMPRKRSRDRNEECPLLIFDEPQT